jgi:hypothetical protein
MSGGEGFAFDYAAGAGVSATPLPPSWTMLLIGIVGFGFVAYRRQRKEAPISFHEPRAVNLWAGRRRVAAPLIARKA